MNSNPETGLEEAQAGNPAFSPLSILRTVWKRKIRIVFCSLLFCAVGVAVVRLLPPVYMAESVVLIDTQKIPEKFVSSTVASDLDDRIEAIRQTLLSSGELRKVIDDFGLYRNERKTHFEEDILEIMRKDISITLEPVGGSGGSSASKRTAAFRIGYQGADPDTVMRVANRLTDLCILQNVKTREEQAGGTSEFIDSHLVEAKKLLDELEAKVSAYKLQHNGELPQQEQMLASALSRLQTELEANRDAINRAQQTRVILEGSLNAMEVTLAAETRAYTEAHQTAVAQTNNESVSLPGQPNTGPPRKTSENMQDQLALLLVRYGEAYPDVIRLRKDIEKVKRIEEERKAGGDADAAHAPASAQPGGTASKGAATANPQPSGSAAKGAATASSKPLSGGTKGVAPASATLAAAANKAIMASAQPAGKGPVNPKTASEPVELTHTREQVAGLQAQIQASEKELTDRKAEQTQILRDLTQYQQHLDRLPVREQEMAQITRDYEMAKANYKSLLDKETAAEMALDMERRQESERFTVIDRAQLPRRPIKPKRPMLYGGAAAASLVLGLLIGFAAEMRKNVFLGEWELPEGTPILARLPHIEIQAASHREKSASRRRWFNRGKGLAKASATSVLLAASCGAWMSGWLHRL